MSDPVTGAFAATGASAAVKTARADAKINLSLSGFGTATVALQRSFDDGASWADVESFEADTEKVAEEPEAGVRYRLNASAYGAGTIAYRLRVAP